MNNALGHKLLHSNIGLLKYGFRRLNVLKCERLFSLRDQLQIILFPGQFVCSSEFECLRLFTSESVGGIFDCREKSNSDMRINANFILLFIQAIRLPCSL